MSAAPLESPDFNAHCECPQMHGLFLQEIVPLCFIALSSQQWIPGMLSGATSLIDIRLGVELLPSLPASRREALEHLHVDAYFGRGRAGLDILQAIKECVNLRSLTITCLDKGLYIDELDLRHLAHLDTCRLQCLPAPARLSLSRGRVELTMTSEQVEAWSQLWPQIQPHVHFVKLEGYQHFTRSAFHSAGGLHACDWPLGIDNFHGLQFLQINCDSVRASGEAEGDLLGHLSYIPHVLLRCQESVGANLSTGSWKVLEIHSAMVFDVTIADVETFMKSIGIFRFTFPANSNKQAAELLRQLRKAGAKTGMPLYESSSTFSPVLECPSNEVVVELSNHRRELQDDPCSPFLEALRRHA